MKRCSGGLVALIGAVCCVGIALFQTCEIQDLNKAGQLSEYSSIKTTELQQQLTVLKVSPTLGFGNLLANATFLRFLQYFSDASNNADVNQYLSADFFDAIITFDPFYRDYYLFLSGSITFHAAQPEKTVELIAKGLERIDPTLVSDSFYIWRYKGTDELLFLGDSKSAKESFENAAEWASQSTSLDSDRMERASRQTAEFLKSNPDSIHAQIAAWNSVFANALNDDIREEAAQKVQQLTATLEAQKTNALPNAAEEEHSIRSDRGRR